MMKLKKNILVGTINFLIILFYFIFLNLNLLTLALQAQEIFEGRFIEIKILDKVSSKNKL